ncbi:MAG: branched-chain amino acid ABC transporter permease [Bacillota bacterium]
MRRLFSGSKWSLVAWGAVLVVSLALPYFPLQTFVLRIASLVFIYSVVTVGLNLLTGYTGQLSVGQAGFFGIGAYTTALLSIHLHSSLVVDLVAATVMAAAVGFLLGLPILRLKGQYLVMATLGFNEVVRLVASTSEFTGGPNGLPGVSSPALFGYVFSSAASLYYLNLAGLLLALIVAALLVNSPVGRSMVAVREDEVAAAAIGINVRGTKLLAFTLAAGIAGFAGVLYAHNGQYVSWQTFVPSESFTMLAMLVVGGMGTLPGPLFGTALLLAMPEALRGASMFRFFLYGLALTVVAPAWPGGLAAIRWPSFGRRAARSARGRERGQTA